MHLLSDQGGLGVTVVLPTKGCRAHSRRTWQSQLALLYGGQPDATNRLEEGVLRSLNTVHTEILWQPHIINVS